MTWAYLLNYYRKVIADTDKMIEIIKEIGSNYYIKKGHPWITKRKK